MRVIFCWAAILLFLSPSALGAEVELQPVAEALAAVRSASPINQTRDAGPELTPVKQRLREWVEAKLSTFPQQGNEADLAKQLNDALDQAKLTCGVGDSARCGQEDNRGFLWSVALSKIDGRYLLVETGVGIRCGFDESAYIYEWRDNEWKLLFQSEQDDYAEKKYSPQNFISVVTSPADVAWNETAVAPLVLTLGYSPWCSSNWQSLYTRLWRTSRSNPAPLPLQNSTDTLYMGNDWIANGRVENKSVIIEFEGPSIDGNVLVRRHIRHYLIQNGDKLKRIGPVALNPRDFVDTWLTNEWAESAHWIDSKANTSRLLQAYYSLHKDFIFGEFDGEATRCRADPTLWQIGFASDIGGDKEYRLGPTLHFLVRWLAPYRFAMVDVGTRQHRQCDIRDKMLDNLDIQ